ncbi:MAG: hypothetical protein ACI83D_000080 [Planctomycetota bacterium]|jgi:hypothetical protein
MSKKIKTNRTTRYLYVFLLIGIVILVGVISFVLGWYAHADAGTFITMHTITESTT